MNSVSEIAKFRLSYDNPGSHLKDYVYARSRKAFAAGDAARDALQTAEAIRERQEAVRRFVVDSVGGLPQESGPVEARTTGTWEGEGFTVEALVYETRPRHYVTASLYLPHERPAKCPAILFLCGHSAQGRLYPTYQSVCQTLAKAGFIVLAQDPVGQGERASYYDPERKEYRVNRAVAEHQHAGMQCRLVGDNIARYFIHDAQRSIDYLVSRPDVDAERIGVTGNSGGGTQTSLVMMCEPRIAAAAPGTFIMSREAYQSTGQAQDAEQIWGGFTGAGFDHEDILLAMAPRPVCVLAVEYDFFPIEGARRTVERARRAWEVLGCPGERLELAQDPATHGYTPALARAAASFFSRHFFGRDLGGTPVQPDVQPEERLYATASGQVGAEFADAEFVFEANLARVRAAAAARAALPAAERQERATAWLRERLLAGREPGHPLNPRLIHRREVFRELDVDVAFWRPEPGLANLGFLLRPHGQAPRGVTIALWDDANRALDRHAAWLIRECAQGRAVLLLCLSGMGSLAPDPINYGEPAEFYGTFNKLGDDLIWLGDSLPALRAYELSRVPEVLSLWPELAGADLRVYAQGRAGVYARLAAAVEPRLANLEWAEPFTYAELVENRHYDTYDIVSRLLPGALQYFDLDELR